MSESDTDRRTTAGTGRQKSGWWWRFTALFLGVPPLAVYGAEEDIDRERGENADR